MEIQTLNQSVQDSFEIFDRDDPSLPGYFEKFHTSSDYFLRILQEYRYLPINKQIIKRVIAVYKAKIYQFYSMDLFKIMMAVKVIDPKAANSENFEQLHGSIYETLIYEIETTKNARYVFKLNIAELKMINQLLGQNGDSEEKTYLSNVISINEQLWKDYVVVNVEPLVSISKKIEQKVGEEFKETKLFLSKIVSEFNLMKKINIEFDHLSEIINRPIVSQDSLISVTQTSKYRIIDRYEPVSIEVFAKIKITFKSIWDIIKAQCNEINPTIIQRIEHGINKKDHQAYYFASDLQKVMKSYQNKVSKDDLKNFGNFQNTFEKVQNLIDKEKQTCENARYIYEIKKEVLEAFFKCSKISEYKEVNQYFKDVIKKIKNKQSREFITIDMEHFVTLADNIVSLSLKNGFDSQKNCHKSVVKNFRLARANNIPFSTIDNFRTANVNRGLEERNGKEENMEVESTVFPSNIEPTTMPLKKRKNYVLV